ncbi:MAG: hypothetical protein RR911_03575 [Oscillospiraceae bacterium]
MDTTKNRENVFIISSSFSISISIIFGIICLKTGIKDYLIDTIGSVNLPVYIVIFLLFFILFFIFYKVMSTLSNTRPLYFSNKNASFVTMIILSIVTIVLLIISFTNEDQIYAQETSFPFWHNINLAILLIIVFLSNATFLFCTMKKNNLADSKDSFSDRMSFIFVSVTIAFILGSALYYLNIFNGDIYHCHAYFASIYNTFYGAPFNDQITGIYGHYGLIFLPFLKLASLFGISNIFKCFILMMSGIGAISFLLSAYSIKIFVKNQTLRFLGMLALPCVLVSMQAGAAFQRDPHRSFLVCILMFLVAYAVSNYEKNSKKVLTLGFILCTFGILWNTEMGLFLSISWASFLCCLELQKSGKKKYFKILLHISSVIASFLLTFGIVNIYDYIVNRNFISLKTFIIPFFCKSLQIKKLEAFLTTEITPWMFMVAILLLFFAMGIKSTKIFKKRTSTNYYSAAYLSLSVMGLASLTYAINRAAYFNFDLIYPLIILMLCIIANLCIPAIIKLLDRDNSEHSMISAGFGMIVICVLFSLSLAFFSNIGYTSMLRQPYKHKNSIEDLANFTGNVYATIDKDTVGIGMGTVELYAMIGKDTTVYLTDYSDFPITKESVNYAEYVLRSVNDKPVLITNTSLDMHKLYGDGAYKEFLKTHKLINTWEYPRDVTFLYYVPLES